MRETQTHWRLVVEPLTTILSGFWARSRWTLALVAAVVLLASVSSIAAPYIFSRFVDQLSSHTRLEVLIAGVLLYALLLGCSTALQSVVQYLSFMSSETLGFIAGTMFFEKLLKKTVAFFVEHNPAEIQSAQAQGQQALNVAVQLGLIVFIPGITQVVLALLVVGASIDPEVGVFVIVYGVAFIIFTYFVNKWTRPFLDAAITASQENARFVGNSTNAMETLRHFGAEAWISTQFANKAQTVRDSWHRFSVRRIGYAVIYGAALAVQFAITFSLLLPRYRSGELSVGGIVLFNTLLLQLNQPFEMIGHSIDDIARSYSRFLPFARMWSAVEEPDRVENKAFIPSEGQIVFEQVGFTYVNGRGVGDVSFVAERGRITFLLGETGSGKSTLFKLALKSIEPAAGKIWVDGVDLRDIARSDWFSVIGVVHQDVVLLNDSLKTNIVLGRPYDEARLREAAEKAAILEFIESLPNGFETTVGERGFKLSGGERQRVAIARALYASPTVLFLDEASSALDEATEADILSHIRAFADEVTVLAITHRKALISPTDRVVALTG